MRTVGSGIKNTTVDDLTERISIVYPAKSRNSRGDIIKGVETVRCNVWAKVLPLGAKRYVDGSVELTNKVTYRVVIRYRTDIMPDDIVIWRGLRLKQIVPSYDLEARRMYIVLECEEMIPDGE